MYMTIFDAIILGAVQGITEFLPISSTGHLVLAQRFLGLSGNFTFDVLLNFGTLAALFIFFRKRIAQIIREVVVRRDARYIGLLLLAVIPTAVVGFLLSDAIDGLGESIWIVVVMLALLGALMVAYGAEQKIIRVQTDKESGWKDAGLIGLAQVLALVPGVSRSGSTILAALNRGYSSKAAADFSFMMAIPTILGASFHVLLSSEGRAFVSEHTDLFIIGNIVSFVFGALAVKLLMRLLHKYGLRPFGWYRLGLAVVLAVLLMTNII